MESISNYKKTKKGQFFILSTAFLLLLLLFIYSQETQNTYIVKSSNFNLVENIMCETCYIGTTSNGSYIDGRYSTFKNDVNNYCLSLGIVCNLSIINNSAIPPQPGNYSSLNYTHYDYQISYKSLEVNYTKTFTC